MRRSRLIRLSALPLLSVAGLLLVACGSSGSSPSGSSSSSSTTGAASNVNLSQLENDVNQAAALPDFSTYAANYGGNISSTSNLAGKKIMIVPGDSQLAACTEIAQAIQQISAQLGMKPTIFANNGTTAEHNTAIENAIHQNYAAIDLGCDYDPTTNEPALKQALSAGIAIAVYGATPQEATASGVTYNTDDPYALDAKVAVEQAVVQHQGKPFHAIAITSNAAPATAIMEDALKAELKATCPACTLDEVNVEVPNWTTQVASTVTSSLLQHPDVTVLFPDYAGELTYMLAGIQAAHRTNVKAYLAFGGGTPFIKLQTAEPGKSIIQSDIGGYPPWTGYLLFLQTVRALEKLPAIPYDQAIGPDRVATPDNAVNVLTTGGWGTDWVNGFRGLLGLSPLSGQDLTNAATLNGAMVGTV